MDAAIVEKAFKQSLHPQGETDTETFYDTDGDDRGYASFDETTIRKPHNEDPGYLSMDELKPSVPKTRRKRKPRNADGKQETRPVLECRMPTLVTKPSFLLPIDEMPRHKRRPLGLQMLEASPPRSLKDLRNIIAAELKQVAKKLSRLERAYYGVGKSIQDEVNRYVSPIKVVMRMLTIFDFSSGRVIEDAIKAGQDPKRYKGDPNNITLLKDVYAKIKQYVPEKFTEISDYCLKILSTIEKYCVSFYDPEKDEYLETAAHYQQQISLWKSTIRNNLEKVKKLQKDFHERIIHYTMFTTPVVTFCKKNECEQVPFLFLFADACTNIRAAMAIMTTWLQADENYPIFLRNDIDDMEHNKEEKIRCMRDSKTRFHSVTYKLNHAEIELDTARGEIEGWKEKEEALHIEKDYLFNLQSELQQECDFKEFRRDELAKNKADFSPDDYNDTYDMLTEEIRYVRDRMPLVKRQLQQLNTNWNGWQTKSTHVGRLNGRYKMTKSIGVVCREIDQDWMLLYRTLPFYPKRGSETIEKDIASANMESARGKEGRALEALTRWRRHHTRAKFEDLIEALKKIKRHDIVVEIDKVLNPPNLMEEEEQEIYVPPSVAPELVPFYKEVERYDQLRKAHKNRRKSVTQHKTAQKQKS
uniref:LOW QUALITY PROTEIN: uncharacterized protein LOC111119080 n=1 Tax=Crassostrea virginica TaxID=6565 RepID=A0A8B8CJL3_CRAVI|nr:LOW QUALITY PROTEIN: uncharacterized protein LOC111119080 [Crassostrea virginica]